MKKKLTIGILAHVDAGKTTLSEALLYLSGKIRTYGRVDHGNTYLDTHAVERERGITVFSKQARFSTSACDYILLDTPGHVDFSAEAERVLTLLDYAILVVSGTDGVQNHTRTLWQLLEHYGIPTLIFVNKTDVAIKQKQEIADELTVLSSLIVPFFDTDTKAQLDERLALLHEEFLNSFLASEPIETADIAQLIGLRRLFPCLFGSALRMHGVEFLLDVLDTYTLEPNYEANGFGARVFKIARVGNARLTYAKITGGSISARNEVSYPGADGKKYAEKVTGLRLYSGDKFEQVEKAGAGEIVALQGLSATYIGQGLGTEADGTKPLLEPVLSYRIALPEGCDVAVYFPKFKQLEEEEPSLHLYWNAELGQIEARLMGEVQIELLRRLIHDRFGIDCELDAGKILYKEKAAAKAIGVGHFEPLRHYAEVQLLIEPQPRGTGLIFDTRVSESVLDLNWQRLVLHNLYQKDHRGTRIGALLTDTKITLVAGKAHLKHTEGGDFREATLRAVRHGLMKAGCTLLEPFYKFRLEIPAALTGRAMNDLQARCAAYTLESSTEETAVITGRGPVSTLHDYTREVIAYTRGAGRLFCTSDGYEPCHNAEEIIESVGYDPETDLENTPHSVFCAHGAGVVVPWQEVDAHKHLDAGISLSQSVAVMPKARTLAKKYELSDEDLEAIMLREFGPIRRKKYTEPKITIANGKAPRKPKAIKVPKNLLIVDGYNVIYAWEELKTVADYSLEKAREELMDIMSNYHAFTKTDVLLVFDAYLVKDGAGSEISHDGYRVVYTRQDQTADAYIEQIMHDLGPDYSIRVVTGDRLLQFSAVSYGISRMTAKEFWDEITQVGNEINDFVRKLAAKSN